MNETQTTTSRDEYLASFATGGSPTCLAYPAGKRATGGEAEEGR
jgi:hypothetical protein